MNTKVLVLNQDYQAVGVCSGQRAFLMVYLRKAEMVNVYQNLNIRTVSRSFQYPSVIRLLKYVRTPYRKVSLTRANIFQRDGKRCVYCGTSSHLTIDHVKPRSQGGRDIWENLVTACQSCNTKKGNRTPEESGMRMLTPPSRPSYVLFLSNFSNGLDETWRPYLI